MAAKLLSAKYKGEVVTLKDLAAQKNIKLTTLHSRWKAAGYPECITNAMLVDRISRQPYSRRTPKYSVDGVPMLLHEMATLAGCSIAMVTQRIKKYGAELSREQLDRKRKFVHHETLDVKRKATVVTFEPGSWERKNLPHAGKSGFNKVERGSFDGHVNRGGQSMPVYAG